MERDLPHFHGQKQEEVCNVYANVYLFHRSILSLPRQNILHPTYLLDHPL